MNRKLHINANDLRPNVLFLLKRVHLAIRKVQDEALAEYGLTSAQMEVLAPTCVMNGVEHRTLVEWLGVTSPTLTNIVDGLVQRGLIQRISSAQDARVKQFFPTDAGRSLFEKVGERKEHFFNRFTEGFTQEELDLFASFMQRLAVNCGDTFSYDEHFKPEDLLNSPKCVPEIHNIVKDEKKQP